MTPTTLGLLGPAEPEVTCDECFELLDEYVELELRGATPTSASPGCARTSRAALPATRTTTACATSSKATTRPPRRVRGSDAGSR